MSQQNKELSDIIVEFALEAYPLMRDGQFFDKNGYPQAGTEVLNKAIAAIEVLIDRAVQKALEEEREFNRVHSNPEPPTSDSLCSICYKWQIDKPGRYMWFRRCSNECGHEHHKDEVWMAANLKSKGSE